MKKEYKALVYLIIGVIFLCWPIGAGAGYAVIKQVSPDDIRLFMGAMFFLLAFIVITGGLSLFVVCYSMLRRREEDEDDKRELALTRLLLNGRGATYRLPPQGWEVQRSPTPQLMEYQDVEFE